MNLDIRFDSEHSLADGNNQNKPAQIHSEDDDGFGIM